MLVSKYKAILFDFDETLVKSFEILKEKHKHAAKKFYNITLTEETIRKYWGLPFEKMITYFYEERDTVENLAANYYSLDSDYKKIPHEDTVRVLNYLHKNKYILGIVTSMSIKSVIKDMKEMGFSDGTFDFFQGSQETKHHKPDPRVFDNIIKVLKKRGIKKEQILYVGDDIRDMQAAFGAGIGFVAVPNGLTTKNEFEKNGARCISSLSNLIV